jgi:hypothetical protein
MITIMRKNLTELIITSEPAWPVVTADTTS